MSMNSAAAKILKSKIKTPNIIGDLNEVIPIYLRKVLTAERIINLGVSELVRQPKLIKCTPLSIVSAFKKCAKMGLEPGNSFDHVYFQAKFNRSSNNYECVASIGYKGYIVLAYRQGIVITARAVYKNDIFQCHQGLNPVLVHEVSTEEEGAFIGAYAIATLPNNTKIFEYLPLSKINQARDDSFAQSETPKGNDWARSPNHPWNKYYDSMARKTPIRRLFNHLPISTEMALAVNYDEQAETGYQDTSYIEEYSEDNLDVSGLDPQEEQDTATPLQNEEDNLTTTKELIIKGE